MKKQVLSWGMLFIVGIAALTACGKQETKADENSEAKELSIDQIDWEVKMEKFDDRKTLSFDYTNNSSYIIKYVEINFKIKDDTTAEELTVLEDYRYERSDEELIETFQMDGFNKKITKPGESEDHSPLQIGWTSSVTKEQFALMEPAEATIEYVGEDNLIHTLYYDYVDDFYDEPVEPREKHTWTYATELGDLIPDPDFEYVDIYDDSEPQFGFYAYDVAPDAWQFYIDECKKAGFTTIIYQDEHEVKVENEDGIFLDIWYRGENNILDVHMSK